MRTRSVRAMLALILGVAAPVLVDTVGVGSAANAAAPPGGTIVFLDGHDIWLTNGDGSRRYRVTYDGTAASPYLSPSMSDGGVIAAGKGPFLVRMKQNGTVLNRMDPKPMTNSVGHPVDGPPVNVAISPDGSKIAYTMIGYGCPIGTDCMARGVTGVTSATRLTGPTMRSYYWEPSWLSNTRLMVHGGYGSHISLQDAGSSAAHWFDDSDVFGDLDSTDLGDAAVSRDGRALVAVRGYGPDKHLINYRVTGDPRTGSPAALATPTALCVSGTDADLGETSWSPDGRAVVTADSSGLVLMYPGQPCSATTYDVLGAGSEPHWSAARLSPGPRQFALGSRPKISGTAKVGRKLTASSGRWSPAPGAVKYRWLRNGKSIAGATKRTLVVKGRDRGKRISVRVTVTKSGYQTRSVTSPAKRVR